MLLHHLYELVEKIGAVLRTRGALGVVLHREEPVLGALHALDRIVQQIDVRQPQTGTSERLPIDGIAVVLARDLDPARFETLHGVVAAAVAELHLEGPGPVGERDHLVSEADAEHGHPPAERAHLLHHGRHVRRIARAVREEHAVGAERQQLLDRDVVGHDRYVAPLFVEFADDVVFDAAVDGHHVVTVVGRAGKPTFLAAHAPHHVVRQFVGAKPCERLGRRGRGRGNHHLLTPFVADDAHQTARVDPPDGGNAVLLEHLGERLGVAEIRRRIVVLAHDHAADGRELRFVVLLGGTVVADQRIGHHHHLIRVGGVRQNFLIAHHRGVEDDLVDGFPVGTESVAVELLAVFKNDFLGKWFHYCLFGFLFNPS